MINFHMSINKFLSPEVIKFLNSPDWLALILMVVVLQGNLAASCRVEDKESAEGPILLALTSLVNIQQQDKLHHNSFFESSNNL